MSEPATKPWDPAEHFTTEADIASYLEAALEDADPALITAALGDIARAKDMSQIARDTKLGRKNVAKSHPLCKLELSSFVTGKPK
ncbi:MAG: putative addiction module antidote protein [Burkholderiales bacterium]|nr:putative addiction module antidote protein [Burkholderiales bacterium]